MHNENGYYDHYKYYSDEFSGRVVSLQLLCASLMFYTYII